MNVWSGTRALDELQPHPRNYNRHSPQQVQRMADRMRHVAYTAPVIIRPDGLLLAGHLRREALLSLRDEGYPPPAGVTPAWEVPVRIVEGTETQELAILAGDNPDPLDLDYDPVGLASLLEELQAQGGLAATGYDDDRLRQMLECLAGEANPESDPTEPDPVSLAEQFGVPPFSVLDARQGYWQARKAEWLSLGIRSELGRGPDSAPGGSPLPAAEYHGNRGDGRGRPL
jgi:hypothetical protein